MVIYARLGSDNVPDAFHQPLIPCAGQPDRLREDGSVAVRPLTAVRTDNQTVRTLAPDGIRGDVQTRYGFLACGEEADFFLDRHQGEQVGDTFFKRARGVEVNRRSHEITLSACIWIRYTV
jgi:hypothetical protein